MAVRRKRRLRTDSSADEESVQLAGRRVFNYLCSEEEYRQNLQRWSSAEGQDGGYQMDELLHLDYSFAFVCPMCKSDGVPDVLCQLEPSFFFWIHIEQEGGGCLCLLAAGVHAEYFLGTKADHVCRSEEVRQCARDRLDRLIASVDESNLVLNLGVRKVSSSAGDQTGEFHLEDTFLVYDSRHILPWWTASSFETDESVSVAARVDFFFLYAPLEKYERKILFNQVDLKCPENGHRDEFLFIESTSWPQNLRKKLRPVKIEIFFLWNVL